MFRSVVGGVIVGIAASTIGCASSAPNVARAAFHVESYRAANGLVRTNLQVTGMDVDPFTGYMYAAIRDGGGTTLLVLDPVTVEPVRQVQIVASQVATLNGVDVAPDGRTVAVTTRTSLVTLRTSDLRGRITTPLPSSTGWHVGMSGGAGAPIVVWNNDTARLLRNGVLTVLPDAPLDGGGGGNPQFTFDDVDPTILWGQGNAGLVKYDVSATPTVIATNITTPFASQSNYLVARGSQLWIAGATIDKSLTTTRFLPDLRTSWFATASARIVSFRDPVLSEYEPDTDPLPTDVVPLRTFSLPSGLGNLIGTAIALPDGKLAILERKGDTSAPPPWYLAIADVDMLSSAYGEYHPVTPFRMVDTRTGNGTGGSTTPLVGGRPIIIDVTGRGKVPQDHVIAVVANVTITQPSAPTYLTLWPSDLDRPTVSNVNALPGTTISNLVTVLVSTDGTISLVNGRGRAHAIIDVLGYYVGVGGAIGTVYLPEEQPRRLVDTRRPFGGTRLGPGDSLTVDVSEFTRDRAAVINVTALGATEPTFITVWPAGRPRPTASNINLGPGDIRPNLVVTELSTSGRFQIFNAHGSVDVLVDLHGRYVNALPSLGGEGPQEGRLYPVEPFRRFDSRQDSPFPAPGYLTSESAVIFDGCCMWTDLVNITAVLPTEDGFLSVLPWEDGTFLPDTPPMTSTVNFHRGDVVANAAYAFESQDFLIYNRVGNTHVVLDVFGYLQGGVPGV